MPNGEEKKAPYHTVIERPKPRVPTAPTLTEPALEEPMLRPQWGEAGRTWDIPLDLESEKGEKVKSWVKPDNTVWVAGEHIGYLDPSSGAFSPRAQTIGEQFGEAFGQVGMGLAKGLGYFFKPFELFHEYAAVPFSMAVTAPWWSEGKPLGAETPAAFLREWFKKEGRFRKEYREWEAPKYLRGAIELIPWFVLPPVARIASALGKLGKGGQLVSKALTPYVALEKGAAKMITLPIKAGGRVVAKLRVPKKVEIPELPPWQEVLADEVARHPERLGMGRVQKVGDVIFGSPRIERSVEFRFKAVERVKLRYESIRDNVVEATFGTLDRTFGRVDDLFLIKEIPIVNTKISHRIVTAPWIKPKVKGASMAENDVMSNPGNYQWLGVNGQKAKYYINQVYKLTGEVAGYGGKEVPKLREIGFEYSKGWLPRRVIARRDPQTGKVLTETGLYATGARPGTVTPSVKGRKFETQIDGINRGYQYAPQDEVNETFLKEIYNMVIAERTTQMLQKEGLALTPNQYMEMIEKGIVAQSKAYGEEVRQLDRIRGLLVKVKQGWSPPGQTIKSIERMYPDAGRAIRMQADKRVAKLTELQRQVHDLQSRLAAEVEASQKLTKPIVGEVGSGKTIAIGSDPSKRFEFRFDVVEVEAPIASHTSAYAINPKFPKNLQPRLRERALPREQVERIARELDPDALLLDTHRLDSGSLIVGADNVVESGNGRLLAIRRAITDYPERYTAYRGRLEETAAVYGLNVSKIKRMKNPVLVRRRVSEVPDRIKFVREANTSVAAHMSPVELAFADSNYISEGSLTRLTIEGKESLAEALRDVANKEFANSFLSNVAITERAQFLAPDGSISRQGVERIGNAILAKAFPGRFGLRLAEWNMEALSPQAKSIITGLAGSAGDLAKLGGAINRGQLKEDYHIALELAEAAERYIRNKAMGLPLEGAMQPTLFEASATPIQRALIVALDKRSRSSTAIRDFIRQYINLSLAQPPPGQAMMPGFKVLAREEILGKILGVDITKSPVLKPARIAAEIPKVEAVVAEAVPESARITLLRKDLARLERDLATGERPKAVVNKQIESVKMELSRLTTEAPPGAGVPRARAEAPIVEPEKVVPEAPVTGAVKREVKYKTFSGQTIKASEADALARAEQLRGEIDLTRRRVGKLKITQEKKPQWKAWDKYAQEEVGIDIRVEEQEAVLDMLEAELRNIEEALAKPIETVAKAVVKEGKGKVTAKVKEPLEYEEMTVDRMMVNVRDRLKSVRVEAKAFAPHYREVKQRAINKAFTEGRIVNLPAWRNRIFPDKTDWGMTGRQIADNINKIFEPEKVTVVLRTASKMARMGVTVKAALDLSWMFIQGSLVLGYDIARWGTGKRSSSWLNGTRAMLKTMFNPKYAHELEAKEPALAKFCAEIGVVMEREAEFIRASDIQRMVQKAPFVGKFLGSLIKQTYGRAGAGFSTGGKVARMTIVKQTKDAWVASGHSPYELGEFVNKLTGVISTKELGISATRRALESATLFAPRYTRAYLMVMRDLLRGTKTANEVRKAMAGMLVGGFLGYSTLCTALGQEPHLNPAPKSLGGDGAEFLAFKINGSIIGLPGFWYSTIRMMTAVNAAAEQDPERLLSLDWRENDFLRWAMGRTSPVVRVADEIMEGKDYLGRRLDTPDDWVSHFSEYFLTIAAANLKVRHPSEEEGKFKRFGAELFGLRAFPQSDWVKLGDMKDEYAQRDFGKPFEELNLEQKDKLLEDYPNYRQFAEDARDRMVLESGEDYEIWLWSAREHADSVFNAGIEDAANALLTGQVQYRDYLDFEGNLRRTYRGNLEAINYIRMANPEVADSFQDWLEENEKPEDKALYRYWELYGNPVRKGGLPDWDATETKVKEFLASLDSGTRDYVLRNRDRGVEKYPPTAKKLRKVQLEGRDVVDEYYEQPEGKERISYRRANPTVDAWLLLMGRVSVPQSETAKQLAIRMLQERDLPISLIPQLAIMPSPTKQPVWGGTPARAPRKFSVHR